MAQRVFEVGVGELEPGAFGVGRQHAGPGGQERGELAEDHSQRKRWRGQDRGPVKHASEYASELRAGHRFRRRRIPRRDGAGGVAGGA